jgi:arginase family enzyme
MMPDSFLDFPMSTTKADFAAPIRVLGASQLDEDGVSSYRGADALRLASRELGQGVALNGIDMGNIAPASLGAQIDALRTDEQKPVLVVLGGDDTVAQRAISAWHETPVIAACHRLRAGFQDRQILWLGLNGPQSEALWHPVVTADHSYLSARAVDKQVLPDWPEAALFWLDASVFDIGHAAGAMEPNSGGVTPDRLVSLLASWTGSIKAIVVTGLAPQRDPRGLTELALAAAIKGLLSND